MENVALKRSLKQNTILVEKVNVTYHIKQKISIIINFLSSHICTRFFKENVPPLVTSYSGVIEHVIYAEGRTPASWDGHRTKATYESAINVLPNISYRLKVEVLRNDLGHSDEKVSNITFDGVSVGSCNPDGDDYDCTFFDCEETIENTTIKSTNGSFLAKLTFEGHSWDCDCDKITWNCSKENTIISFTPMTAVARVTLTPIIGI